MVADTKPKTRKTAPRSTGRPSKIETERIRDKILDVAAVFFFTEGYGATSIEAIARRARIAKRTIYSRFTDKPAIFRAVVHRVIERVRPADVDHLFEGKNIEEILYGIAKALLRASLSYETLAMYRVILAEATRFPELALIMNEQGTRKEALQRIAQLLERMIQTENGKPKNTIFAAEQFLQMVVAAPQRRALGLGVPMTCDELDIWAKDTVSLFLRGYQA